MQGDGAKRDVEGETRAAMQILSALSDAAISGGKLSSEMSNANASTAKCQPWSRPDYLSRLASFSPMTWFNKPLTSTFWQRSRTLRGCGMVVLATAHAHFAKWATATCASCCVGIPPALTRACNPFEKNYAIHADSDACRPVSGVECARHGWRNDGDDRLRCDRHAE